MDRSKKGRGVQNAGILFSEVSATKGSTMKAPRAWGSNSFRVWMRLGVISSRNSEPQVALKSREQLSKYCTPLFGGFPSAMLEHPICIYIYTYIVVIVISLLLIILAIIFGGCTILRSQIYYAHFTK